MLRVGSSDDPLYTPFVGSIVAKKESTYPGELDKYLVIDGQQRITTATLLILAICEYLRDNNATCGNTSADKLFYTHMYIINMKLMMININSF